MLDLPHAVVAELVGQLRLLEAVAEGLRLFFARRLGDLHFEEDREFHDALAPLTKSRCNRFGASARKRVTIACTTNAFNASPSTRSLPVICAALKSLRPASRS